MGNEIQYSKADMVRSCLGTGMTVKQIAELAGCSERWIRYVKVHNKRRTSNAKTGEIIKAILAEIKDLKRRVEGLESKQ
jgi:hypothetical protein